MKQLVEYELDDDSTIIVEVDLSEASIERAGRGNQIVKAKERFADVLEQIKPAARTVFSKLGDLNADEIGVTKAGAIIASADTEANFTVSLMWKRVYLGSPSHTRPPSTNASLKSE